MEKFKVGDRVYCIIFGWGVVNKVRFDGDYPIEVNFYSENGIYYTIDGRYFDTSKPTLSFTEYTLQGFTQERPITLPEVGELCLVRDNKGAMWHVRRFEDYITSEALCFKTDSGYWREMKRIKILD